MIRWIDEWGNSPKKNSKKKGGGDGEQKKLTNSAGLTMMTKV
jgi:hypothetical protein